MLPSIPHRPLQWARLALLLALVPVLIAGVLNFRAQQAVADAPSTLTAASSPMGALPASVDLRRWSMQSASQGPINSCVSWAIAYNIMGWYANKMGSPTIFAPMYVYSQTHIDESVDGGGSRVADANTITNLQGVAPLGAYQPQGNYDFKAKPTNAQVAAAAPYRMQPAEPLYGVNVKSDVPVQRSIQQALANGTPVGVLIPLYGKFYNLTKTNPNFSLAEATGETLGLHYMAAFGYDATGLWVQNSWGQDWGQDGFAHIAWDFVGAHVIEAEAYPGFIASSLPHAAPIATPVPSQAAPQPTLPHAPRKLHTIKRGKSTVRIAWQAPASTTPIYGYWVVVTSKRYGPHRTYNLGTNQRALTITKLARGTTYKVRIQAINARGLGKQAAYLNVRGTARR